jgi:hypothetical protein
VRLPSIRTGRRRVLRRLGVSRTVVRHPRGGAPGPDDSVIDAVVAARLFGIPLLTLEARVVVDTASAADPLQLDTVGTGGGRRALELVDGPDGSGDAQDDNEDDGGDDDEALDAAGELGRSRPRR